MSSLVNKVKEALHSDKSSQPEGTHGPHSTRTANAADPRIDSDRDHRAAHHGVAGETHTGTGNYTTGSGNYGTTGGANHGTDSRPFTTTDGPATKTDGPHNSNLLNKADPRVDSDRDHSRNLGANPHGTSGTGAYNVSDTTHTGALGNTGTLGGNNVRTHDTTTHTGGYSGGIPEGTAGQHNSRIANAADPRIDSDLDGSRTVGGNTGTHTGAHTGTHTGTHTGSHGHTGPGAFGSSTTTHGTATHGTAHTGGLGTSTNTHNTTTNTAGAYGSGPAPNTVGPHKSDMANKLDPRVDSNLDGSKTYGGDKTFNRSNNTSSAYAHKDPTDAAQVPPSVMQQHIGAPTVAHDDHSHDRVRRHSVSHQEDHRGL